MLFLEEFPCAEERASYYQEEYYEEQTGNRFLGIFEWAIRAFRKARMKDVLRHLPQRIQEDKKDAFLDIGCGRGLLLECFKKQGWQVAGTQLSETASLACERQHGVKVHRGELPELKLESDSFRAIVLYHVLEHIDKPFDYLKEAHRLLRSDGLLVIEVPDASSLGSRLLGSRNFCFDFPHHLFFFTPSTLRAALGRVGFSVSGSTRFSLEYTPYTTLQNLLNFLPGMPNRLYRSLMKNAEGVRLRKLSLTWIHFLLGMTLALPAFIISLSNLIFPTGNTLRFYCRKAGATRESVRESPVEKDQETIAEVV